MKRHRRQAGFSLIELMTGVLILGVLIALGGPSLSRWIQNRQIRNSAEAILNGLSLARAEAVRRNTNVRFHLVSTATSACALADSGKNWVVSLDDPTAACDAEPSDTVAPRIIRSNSAAEGSPNAVINGNGVSQITFNGLGQASAAATINITNPTGGACGVMRCLDIIVSTAGQIRMCNPALDAADDPQGC